ncbi:hypothetical protein GW17_00057737 [Ensete ventricosum]|nr:hypothetical protein GW17_00057737 [Ensete ventricosum]
MGNLENGLMGLVRLAYWGSLLRIGLKGPKWESKSDSGTTERSLRASRVVPTVISWLRWIQGFVDLADEDRHHNFRGEGVGDAEPLVELRLAARQTNQELISRPTPSTRTARKPAQERKTKSLTTDKWDVDPPPMPTPEDDKASTGAAARELKRVDLAGRKPLLGSRDVHRNAV